MDCKECDGLLVAYVKGELTKPEAELVECHIRICEHCRWNEAAARRSLEVIEDVTDAGTPIAKIAAMIIARAIAERASDIHIERQAEAATGEPAGQVAPLGSDSDDMAPLLAALEAGEEQTSRWFTGVRFRIDGVLHEALRLPGAVHEPLAVRLMVMAEMNAFERRVPQFGRIRTEHEGKSYDLRVATLPGTRGLSLVIRLFDRSMGMRKLDELGLSDVNRERLETACRQPTGIFLVCGPAGAGKTTLLYAMLARLSRPEISVLTIEDPVEVEIPGATQIHVNRKMGLTYPSALEAFMRSDPDIIMCSDIPDEATASALLRLAVTGHLVLALLACADLAEGILKLRDLVPDPLLIAHTLIGGVGVRLVRQVCASCAQDEPPTEKQAQMLRRMGAEELPPAIRRGPGCDHCRQTGYHGRTGIHEVLLFDEELAGRIADATADDLRAAIRPAMVEDAAAKVLAGVTTPDEAIRVAGCLLRK